MSRFRRASTETHPPVTRRAYCFGGFDPGGVASVDLVALPCASARHVTARIISGPILLRLPRRRDQLQPCPPPPGPRTPHGPPPLTFRFHWACPRRHPYLHTSL